MGEKFVRYIYIYIYIYIYKFQIKGTEQVPEKFRPEVGSCETEKNYLMFFINVCT